MAPNLPQLDTSTSVFTAPGVNLSWGLFVPLVFASNVVVATFAWIIVGLVMR
jgi:hypothetical protein